MNKVSFEKREFRIDLNLTSGTGFDWLIVYQSANVSVEPVGFKVDDKGEILCGAPGVKTFQGRVSDDEEGILILKCARPWEGDGSFNTYIIRSKDGSIIDIEKSEQNLYGDFSFEANNQDEGMFRLYLPKDWQYKEITDRRRVGLAVSPQGAIGRLEMFHSTSFKAVRLWRKVKKIRITDIEYTAVMRGSAIACLYGNDTFCVFRDAGWQKKYFLDIIRMLDTVRWETE